MYEEVLAALADAQCDTSYVRVETFLVSINEPVLKEVMLLDFACIKEIGH